MQNDLVCFLTEREAMEFYNSTIGRPDISCSMPIPCKVVTKADPNTPIDGYSVNVRFWSLD